QCPVGYCCSKHGFCGQSDDFCKANCGFQCDGHPEASNAPAPQVGTYIHQCNIPGTVAMTFDDGPHTLTNQLLDTLKAKGLHVTFFIIGNTLENANNGPILKRAYDEGHHIAQHTYNHIDTGLKIVPEAEVRADLAKTEDAIYKIIGKRTRYFRPPTGISSPEQLKMMTELGYQVIHWNLDTNDWRHRDAQKVRDVYAQTLRGMDPKKHQLLALHHDIHDASVIAAPDVIKMVEDACFKIVTVPECLGDKQWYKDEGEHAGHRVPSIDANCVPKYPDVDGTCGVGVECPAGSCCSLWGYCGSGDGFC
ncbi:glycoside hydrolase/deacetylase, partial [Basidiobolus meristosporus CBS 931.73]